MNDPGLSIGDLVCLVLSSVQLVLASALVVVSVKKYRAYKAAMRDRS